MYKWQGNTSSSATSSVYQLPMVIENYRVVNKSASTIGLNVYLIDGVNQFSISPLNQEIQQGEMYYEDSANLVVLASEQIKVQVSGSADFNFTLNNIEPVGKDL